MNRRQLLFLPIGIAYSKNTENFATNQLEADIDNTVFNIEQLKKLHHRQRLVDLLGYYKAGDGGGGRFYFDHESTESDNRGTVIAPNDGIGRWKRIYTGAVHVDWFGGNSIDATEAFRAASTFLEIECSPRTYLMNSEIKIKGGQVWRFNGATIFHTNYNKVMFRAVNVDGWSLIGPCTLQGKQRPTVPRGEKALAISGCNRYRVRDITAQKFSNSAFHISPGEYKPVRSDQGQWTGCAAYGNLTGIQIDAGTGAEYNTFINFNAAENITGAIVSAGNTTFTGGSISENINYGIILLGGMNNGHGIFNAVNINHNNQCNIKTTGVTNGFTFSSCHIYADSATTGTILLLNGSQDICFNNCIIDAPVINESTGSNRISNSKLHKRFTISGSNKTGLILSKNY